MMFSLDERIHVVLGQVNTYEDVKRHILNIDRDRKWQEEKYAKLERDMEFLQKQKQLEVDELRVRLESAYREIAVLRADQIGR